MAQNNPFAITFGKVPSQFIPRTEQMERVREAIRADEPSEQLFMITGPRRSGKTVFLTELANELSHDPAWIICDLNAERDLLQALAAKLYSSKGLSEAFEQAKIDLSFFGLGIKLNGTRPLTDIEVALSRMLEHIGSRHQRVLIAIDEVTSSAYMRTFASAFQMLIRQDLPVFLLMTGLYENINRLQNERSLTFLYRAPKIELAPLGMRTMARSYERVFGIEREQALDLARLTRGYSFAFQALGYLVWERRGYSEQVMEEYRQMLWDLSYDKIWDELSDGDRRIAYGIAASRTGRIADVRSVLGIETNQFNPYRRRLVRKGVVNGSRHGYVTFVLPLFEEYVLERYGDVELD